jgi:hypothetical protein
MIRRWNGVSVEATILRRAGLGPKWRGERYVMMMTEPDRTDVLSPHDRQLVDSVRALLREFSVVHTETQKRAVEEVSYEFAIATPRKFDLHMKVAVITDFSSDHRQGCQRVTGPCDMESRRRAVDSPLGHVADGDTDLRGIAGTHGA